VALEGQSREKIEFYERSLLANVPDAEPIGNVTLRQLLEGDSEWTEELYWVIRNRLIERGELTTGRGRGVSVRRALGSVTASLQNSPLTSVELRVDKPREADLYAPMFEVIKSRWAQDYRLDSLIVEITASQGARQTGGKWTRPDITAASYRTFPYVPGRHFDLITFEVKSYEAADVTVVYEALGHRRAATRSYVLIYLPDDKRTQFQNLLDEICLVSKQHGIGVFIAADARNYDKWEELVEATRHEPDPERLNDFLATQVEPVFREQIIKWFR
jgi:hypothetical protein